MATIKISFIITLQNFVWVHEMQTNALLVPVIGFFACTYAGAQQFSQTTLCEVSPSCSVYKISRKACERVVSWSGDCKNGFAEGAGVLEHKTNDGMRFLEVTVVSRGKGVNGIRIDAYETGRGTNSYSTVVRGYSDQGFLGHAKCDFAGNYLDEAGTNPKLCREAAETWGKELLTSVLWSKHDAKATLNLQVQTDLQGKKLDTTTSQPNVQDDPKALGKSFVLR